MRRPWFRARRIATACSEPRTVLPKASRCGPVRPGCWLTAEELPAVFGHQPCHELLQPGIVVRGRLRDQDGQAISGAVLRGADYPRGPSTVTDPEGRFVLAGLEPRESIQVFHPTPPATRTTRGRAIDRGHPARSHVDGRGSRSRREARHARDPGSWPGRAGSEEPPPSRPRPRRPGARCPPPTLMVKRVLVLIAGRYRVRGGRSVRALRYRRGDRGRAARGSCLPGPAAHTAPAPAHRRRGAL